MPRNSHGQEAVTDAIRHADWRSLFRAAALGALILPAWGLAAPTDDAAAVALDVAKRARPAWDPAGLGSGGFTLYPSLELGVARDDNVYRQSEDENQDVVRFVRPRIIGTSRWSRHELRLDAGMDASYFRKADRENVQNWFAGLGGRIDFARNAWLRADVTFRELHEERGDPESPFTAREPVSRKMSEVRIEAFRRLNRLSLGIEGRHLGLAYDSAVDSVTGRTLVQDDRDRSEREVSGRAGLQIAPWNEVFLRATHFSRRYDRPQGDDRFDRDSDGSEVALGARLDIGTVLAGELFAGWRRQKYDKDERLPVVDGVSYGGALTWNVTPLTTIRGTARRTVNESALRRASGYLASTLTLSLDHELRRNLLIGGDIGRTKNKYVGIQREDDILTGTVRAVWKFSRMIEATLGYRLQRRDSTLRRDDYDKDYIYLDLRFSL